MADYAGSISAESQSSQGGGDGDDGDDDLISFE
jgi:hypothetical protein